MLLISRRLATFGSLIAGVIASASGASADIGVGVGGTPIVLAETALHSQSYTLSPLLVVNTGTESARYTVTVQRVSPGEQQSAPAEWFQFGSNGFLLTPQQSMHVPVTLTIPDQAAPGPYLTNLVATAGSPSAAGGGATLGAAAATKVTFTVAPSVAVESEVGLLRPDWLVIALAAGAGALGVLILGRLLGIRLQIERSQPDQRS